MYYIYYCREHSVAKYEFFSLINEEKLIFWILNFLTLLGILCLQNKTEEISKLFHLFFTLFLHYTYYTLTKMTVYKKVCLTLTNFFAIFTPQCFHWIWWWVLFWCCVQKHVVKKIEHNLGLVQDWWSENEVSHFTRG